MEDVKLQSTITCPCCGHQKQEKMSTDACQFLYECEGCGEVLKPKEGDCCVYCSYGTIPSPLCKQVMVDLSNSSNEQKCRTSNQRSQSLWQIHHSSGSANLPLRLGRRQAGVLHPRTAYFLPLSKSTEGVGEKGVQRCGD